LILRIFMKTCGGISNLVEIEQKKYPSLYMET